MEMKFCVCFLTVKGHTADLLRFDRDFQGKCSRYSVNNLHPTPKGLDDNAAYLWRDNNWGTPWDLSMCVVSKQNTQLEFIIKYEYVIKIAWEAPIGAVLEASKRYPALEFSLSYGSYTEEGKTTINNGEALVCG